MLSPGCECNRSHHQTPLNHSAKKGFAQCAGYPYAWSKRMNAIEARMLNHNLTPWSIHCLMCRHHELATAAADSGVIGTCGGSVIPRPISADAIRRVVVDEDHPLFAAVTDSIDTMLEPVIPASPTDSLRGSEERVTAYMKRHERGEQLYHPQDQSQRIQIKCQH